MRNTSREVVKQGLLKYLEEYSHSDEIIKEANFHLPLLRTISKGKHGHGKKYRAQFIDSFGRVIYENLSQSSWNSIIPFLSASDLIHSSTFIIDDIVDKQNERFGDCATWKKFGLNEAIFTGFRLREIAEKIIIDKQETSLKNKIKLLGVVSDIHRKTYDGQSLNDKLLKNYNHEVYLERCNYFGGVFLGGVAQGSAILANANEEQIKLAKEIGEIYGTAMMIRNDLKDYMTSELLKFDHGISKALKRIPLEDFKIGRITYPLYVALNSQYKDKLESLLGKPKLTLDEEKEIVSAVANSGGFDKTIDLIEEYKSKALNLCENLPENESKYILKDLINLMKNSRDYTNLMKESVK